MPLRATFAPSSGSNVDISARIRAYQASVTQYAEQGSVAMSTLEVDDPDGGINILGLRTISLREESEGSNQQYIYRGFTADRDITRGDSFRTGSARLWHVNMTDANSIISRRIMRGSDANRPAETDVQRVQWLLGTSEFGGLVTQSRYMSTRFPVAMDANDYRDQSNQQILDDCSQASGKNFWVMYDEPMNAYGLFYDFAGSSAFRSNLRLTNILGFVDNDITYGVSEADTKLNRDPSRVYSGVILPFTGGEVYIQNSTTATEFFSRDTTAPSVNVRSTAKATARANRYLTDIRTEADVISTSFKAPLNRVNHLQVGHAVQAWFAHFPGYESGWNWMRVLTRTVTATSEEWYTIEVELAAAVGGLDPGSGVAFPPVPVVDTTPQSCTADNGLSYFYTTNGDYSALNNLYIEPVSGGLDHHYHFYSRSLVEYWAPGGGPSDYPDAGGVDYVAGNDSDCVVTTTGAFDMFTGGGTFVRLRIVGPGTMTISNIAHSGATCHFVATSITATLKVAGTQQVIATDTQTIGTNLTITIPGGGCAHFIDVQANGSWGFGGATLI